MHLSRILKSFSPGLAGVFAALCVMIASASAGPLVTAGGVAATPTVYKVTITKIEFFNGAWTTFFSGTCTIDIASVSAGGDAGSCGGGNTLDPGTYTQMRLTIKRTFDLKGSTTNADPAVGGLDQACRTSTGAASTTQGTFSDLNSGSTDGGAATEQTLKIPTDSNGTIAAAINAVTGMSIDSSSLTMTLGLTLTVPEGESEAPSGLSMDFQVENKLEFLTTGADACTVANMPPIITITTSSGTSTFEPTL